MGSPMLRAAQAQATPPAPTRRRDSIFGAGIIKLPVVRQPQVGVKDEEFRRAGHLVGASHVLRRVV